MATPQQLQAAVKTRDLDKARTVVAAKPVQLALVTYFDEYGMQQTQLAVVGDNTVHMLDGKTTGFSNLSTPSGRATEWLRDGVFASLGKKKAKKS